MLSRLYNRVTGRSGNPAKPDQSAPSAPKPFPLPALADLDNEESEISPADLRNPPADPVDAESDLVELVLSRFDEASKARQTHEREWLECDAFRRGNQWVEWRDATSSLESLKDPNDPYRSYLTVNLIRPALEKLIARATLSKPDASVKPLTASPQDQGAADEARDLLDHYDRLFARQTQTLDLVDSAAGVSTAFLKVTWDPAKPAYTSYLDAATGQQVVAKPDGPDALGDIEETLVPAYEVYPDPKARAWEECGWLIHAKVRPLSYLQEKYGERGYGVSGEAGAGNGSGGSNAESRMDAITGNTLRGGAESYKNSAIVYECWEKPTARFRKGRRIVVAGRRLLLAPADCVWPYAKNDDFPFALLHYKKMGSTLWALNAVHDLLPLQRQLNNTLSRLADRVNTDKATILVAEHSEIGLDAYTSRRNFQKITYRGSNPPTYQSPPTEYLAWQGVIQMYKGLMEDIAGVHEVSNGQVPAGVTAGNAIEMLQQSDTTQMAGFTAGLEAFAQQRAEWEIALAAQFYREPRLVGISEESSAGQQAAAARSFLGLTGGGNVRVEVTAGSATPKTPAARIQQWMDFAKSGMLQPQNLPVFKALIEEMGLERSDTLTERVEAAIAEVAQAEAASQPNPAAVQQIKGQQAQAQAAQQEQTAQALEAIKDHGELELLQAKQQGEIALQQMKDENALKLLQLQDLNKLELARYDKEQVDFKLSGTMDSAATVQMEQQNGLTKAKTDPVPAAPKPGASGSTTQATKGSPDA